MVLPTGFYDRAMQESQSRILEELSAEKQLREACEAELTLLRSQLVVGATTAESSAEVDYKKSQKQAKQLKKQDQEIERWEEDNYQRRQVTKKDKQKRKRLLAQASRLETIVDVGNLGLAKDLQTMPSLPSSFDKQGGRGRRQSGPGAARDVGDSLAFAADVMGRKAKRRRGGGR